MNVDLVISIDKSSILGIPTESPACMRCIDYGIVRVGIRLCIATSARAQVLAVNQNN